jgi:hypothetical protein
MMIMGPSGFLISHHIVILFRPLNPPLSSLSSFITVQDVADVIVSIIKNYLAKG